MGQSLGSDQLHSFMWTWSRQPTGVQTEHQKKRKVIYETLNVAWLLARQAGVLNAQKKRKG